MIPKSEHVQTDETMQSAAFHQGLSYLSLSILNDIMIIPHSFFLKVKVQNGDIFLNW